MRRILMLLLLITSLVYSQTIREMKFENVSLDVVLKSLSEISGMNVVFDPEIAGELQKPVNIAIYRPMPVGEAMNIILRTYNLIAVPVDTRTFRITKAGSITVNLAGLEDREVQEIINFIKPRVSPSAEIVVDKTLKTITIRDEEDNIRRLEPLLKDYRRLAQALVPKEEIQTRVFYLRMINLDEAENRIKPYITQDTLITRAYDFKALVIRDTVKKLSQYEEILRPFLASAPTERKPVTKIFYLRYITPEEFIRLIEPYRSEAGLILSEGVERATQQLTQQQAQTTTTPIPILKDFNAVMLTDYPDIIQRIKETFKDYISDAPVRIAIEARIAEISSENLRELGINWNLLLSQARVPEFWSGGVGQSMGVGAIPSPLPGLSPTPGGILVFTYQKGILNALNLRISALESINRAKSLAKPMVIAINGQKATIRQGVQIPYITVDPQRGATTAFKDVVLQLDVTPIVSPDGRILIDLELKRDTVGVQTPQGPAINTKEVKTKVIVENGQILVLGGVIDTQESKTDEGVPYLIRVPLLKYLFGQERVRQSDKELLIFITPTLITQ
ncbi:MAG: pilus assembly protein [Aquificaceae bacterium]